jgi:hypothetical protein
LVIGYHFILSFLIISNQFPELELLQTGILSFENKDFWCVLATKNLTMYETNNRTSPIHNHLISLVYAFADNNRLVVVNDRKKEFELLAPNRSKFNAWKNAFSNAGVCDFLCDSDGVCIEYYAGPTTKVMASY